MLDIYDVDGHVRHSLGQYVLGDLQDGFTEEVRRTSPPHGSAG
jgi:hypothetical protein